MTQIQVNQRITAFNSTKPELKEKAQRFNSLANWKTITNVNTLELAEYLKKGYSVRGGVKMNGNSLENVESISWLFLDFDSSTLEQTKQTPIYKYGALYYYTPSYQPEINEKHRLVFKLDRPISATEYKLLYSYIVDKFYPSADRLTDAGRLFFGATSPDYVVVIDPDVTLPVDGFLSVIDTGVTSSLSIDTVNGKKTDDDHNSKLDKAALSENDTIKPRNLALQHIGKHIWLEICNTTDIDSLYCLDVHNFVKQPSGQNLAKWHGHRPEDKEKPNGSGFLVVWNDEKLPPTWQNQATGEKGNFIDYWFKYSGKEFDSIKWEDDRDYLNYAAVVNDICNYFDVPEYDINAVLTAKHQQKLEKSDDDEKLSDRQKLERKIRMRFRGKDAFRFNEMSLTVDMGEEQCNMTTIASVLDCKYGIVSRTATVKEVLMMIANENRYHPVKEYLVNNYDESIVDIEAISSISTRYFGTSKPIYDIYMKKMLIGAVRRVIEPGCYLKEMVILQGSQNAGKSQWIRKLAGEKWFNDQLHVSGRNGLQKDDKSMIRRFWIHEIAEIDKLYSKADDAALKSIISSPSDNFRVPYMVDTECFPRMSIFIGTTNREDILKDPTGETRYLVIPVEKGANEIDLKLIESERNMLWATAYHLYMQNEQHWLTDEEQEQRKNSNARFIETDEWYELIKNYLADYESSSITVIMADCLRIFSTIELGKPENGRKVRDILNKLGWKPKGDKKICGKVIKHWVSPEPIENALTVVDSFNRVKHILYPDLSI